MPPLRALAAGSDPLEPPWPSLLIAGGRRAVGLALGLRRAAGCFTVFVQDPRVAPRRFDLVVAPRHDRVRGPNVVETRTALHRVTPARLAEAGRRFAPGLEALPRPLVAVLVGGASRRHRFEPADGAALGRALAAMAREAGAGLAITASRRTAPASMEALVRGARGDAGAALARRGREPLFRLSRACRRDRRHRRFRQHDLGGLCQRQARLRRADAGARLEADRPLLPGSPRGPADRTLHGPAIDDWAPRPPLDETARAAGIVRRHYERWCAAQPAP